MFAQPAASDPHIDKGQLQWFSLTETREDVLRMIGQPKMVAPFGMDFESWQYQIGEIEHDDFSHFVVFRKSDRRVISVTRTFETERNVDEFFPDEESSVYRFTSEDKTTFSMRVRLLSGDRLLIAPGVAARGQKAGQIVLMRRSELKVFYPWLDEQISARKKPTAE